MTKLADWARAIRSNALAVEDLLAAGEAVLMSAVGRLACWLTPLPSAVLVARATGQVFGLVTPWPLVMAVIIELVGLTTSNLWLEAREWNRTRRKSDPPANERLAMGLMLGYFATAFALLLAFEAPHVAATGDWPELAALLFPALSAVGVVTLNERVLQFHRRAEVEAGRAERRGGTRAARKPAQKPAYMPEQGDVDYRHVGDRTRQQAAAILAERPGLSGSELGRMLGRSERLGRKLRAELLPVAGDNGTEAANGR